MTDRDFASLVDACRVYEIIRQAIDQCDPLTRIEIAAMFLAADRTTCPTTADMHHATIAQVLIPHLVPEKP